MKATVGVDPGVSGALAVIVDGDVWAETFVDDSIGEVIRRNIVNLEQDDYEITVYVEKVHSFPGQGVASSFKFGKAFGEIIGALDVMGVPYKLVSPQAWQKTISGLPKKKDGPVPHKRALKTVATQRFPKCKPTLKTADALLIAEYGERDRR